MIKYMNTFTLLMVLFGSINCFGKNIENEEGCDVQQNNCGKNSVCQLDSEGRAHCVCAPGFEDTSEGCTDIDECEGYPDPCDFGFCQNYPGTFKCECPPGFKMNEYQGCEDIDECRNSDICGAKGECVDIIGGHLCKCPRGLKSGEDGCIDIDECSERDSCLNGQCLNLPGSFACECPPGYFKLSIEEADCTFGECIIDIGGYRCDCPVGFTSYPPDHECVDIDECQDPMEDVCNIGYCLNVFGSFECICPPDFKLNEQRTDCIDIDECEETDICHSGRCINYIGGFECRCSEGYAMDLNGFGCTDIDECEIQGACINKRCLNVPGSFTCTCASGFKFEEERMECIDINECENWGICNNGVCTNNLGSYECHCPEGLILDPDVGGCVGSETGNCFFEVEGDESTSTCSEIIGSNVTFAKCCCMSPAKAWGETCKRCPDVHTERQKLCPGVELEEFKPNPIEVFLEDIDECTELPGLCQSGSCVNTFGSFTCISPDDRDDFLSCRSHEYTDSDGVTKCGCLTGFFEIGENHCLSSVNEFYQLEPVTTGYPSSYMRGDHTRKVNLFDSGIVSVLDLKVNTSLSIFMNLNRRNLTKNQVLMQIVPLYQFLEDYVSYKIIKGNGRRIFRIKESLGAYAAIELKDGYESEENPIKRGFHNIIVKVKSKIGKKKAKKASLGNSEIETALKNSFIFEVKFFVYE